MKSLHTSRQPRDLCDRSDLARILKQPFLPLFSSFLHPSYILLPSTKSSLSITTSNFLSSLLILSSSSSLLPTTSHHTIITVNTHVAVGLHITPHTCRRHQHSTPLPTSPPPASKAVVVSMPSLQCHAFPCRKNISFAVTDFLHLQKECFLCHSSCRKNISLPSCHHRRKNHFLCRRWGVWRSALVCFLAFGRAFTRRLAFGVWHVDFLHLVIYPITSLALAWRWGLGRWRMATNKLNHVSS